MSNPGSWKAVLPGPVWVFAWIAGTVTAPLVAHRLTHRWEETPAASWAAWWTVAAAPVAAAVVGARLKARSVRPGQAVPAGTLVAAVHVLVSYAAYRWVMPLREPVGGIAFVAVPLASVAAAGGWFAGVRSRSRRRRALAARLAGGAAIALAGALLAPVTVRLGAEASSSPFPDPTMVRGSQTVTLRAGTAYGIFSWDDPDCRISDQGLAGDLLRPLSIKPGDLGSSDYASFRLHAPFSVAVSGDYTVVCTAGREEVDYAVGPAPAIGGVVGTMVRWPRPLLWLLGALPGLWALARSLGRPRASRSGQGAATIAPS